MPDQVYFEDVQEGTELPTLEKNPTTQQLVKYAGASGDYYQIHYDQEFARSNGLPNVVLHGALKNAFLGQLMTDWIGEHGTLKSLSAQYRGMDLPGTPMYAKGVVKKKYVENGENLVECEIWLENAKGEKTTPGSAIVILPSRILSPAPVPDSNRRKVAAGLAHTCADQLQYWSPFKMQRQSAPVTVGALDHRLDRNRGG